MYLKAGEVASYVSGLAGVLDTGKFPTGTDVLSQVITDDLRGAGFGAVPDPKVMRKKYGKLLMNVGNSSSNHRPRGKRQGDISSG